MDVCENGFSVPKPIHITVYPKQTIRSYSLSQQIGRLPDLQHGYIHCLMLAIRVCKRLLLADPIPAARRFPEI